MRTRVARARDVVATRIAAGLVSTVAVVVILSTCVGPDPTRPGGGGSQALDDDPASGGAMTVYVASSRAFSQPGPTLTADQLAAHQAGDAAFEATFVPAPAPVNPGLGPRFDNVSCSGCHTSDGRGRPPEPGDQFNSMLFRVSVPGTGAHDAPAPAPGFGTQIELRAIVGLDPMATAAVTYTDSVDQFADGTPDTLHVPHYVLSNPYRPLPPGMMLSPRVAPPNFGLGLLAAIPDSVIVARATADDAVRAGVAGHPNYVWDPTVGRTVLGRFGLKANVGSLLQQAAAAYNADMGITSSVDPDETCTDDIPACAPHAAEVSDSTLNAVAAYLRTLAVPGRRNTSAPAVRRGQVIFAAAGCSGCHLPTVTTGDVVGDPELSQQRIHPYTDLLLHDMGAGLADGRPDFLASGTEWRTPPLWGIGLTAVVNGHTTFLHDGRARSLLEAIMWHGGQAAAARDYVRRLSAGDRDDLITFLNSL